MEAAALVVALDTDYNGAMIVNHGIIEKLQAPAGFVVAYLADADSDNHYLEMRASGTKARICYEQSDDVLPAEDLSCMQRLFSENISGRRRLQFQLDERGMPVNDNDIAVYDALCQSLVFGGRLVADGTCINEEQSIWQVEKVDTSTGARAILTGDLRFCDSHGKLMPRRALLAMPVPPSQGGCGYLWLEAEGEELERWSRPFMETVAAASFRPLVSPEDNRGSSVPEAPPPAF